MVNPRAVRCLDCHADARYLVTPYSDEIARPYCPDHAPAGTLRAGAPVTVETFPDAASCARALSARLRPLSELLTPRVRALIAELLAPRRVH